MNYFSIFGTRSDAEQVLNVSPDEETETIYSVYFILFYT